MGAVTEVNPSSNNGYGYVEFKLDGTDYSGTYTSSTYVPYANIMKTYNYTLVMSSFKNYSGTDIYSLDLTCIDEKGFKTQRHIERAKNQMVRISAGNFDTIDGMIDFWDEVESNSK